MRDANASQERILVVGGEAQPRAALAASLRAEGYLLDEASDGAEALDRLAELAPHLVLADETAWGDGGGALVKKIQARDAEIAVVVTTAARPIGAGIEALSAGADGYLTKPINPVELSLMIKRALGQRRLRAEGGQLRARLAERYRFENMIGASAPMQAVFKTVTQVAAARASVLLSGEAGTGKGLIAAAIHEKSARALGPFIKVHCGALPAPLLESELFGHEQGGAARAAARHDGSLAQANGGTLFLGEIGALSTSAQARLLRFLEERQFERVGGTETVGADARVIASTTRNLPRLVDEGKFREDLLRQMAAIRIELPALRDRPTDVMPLATHFLNKYTSEHDKAISGFGAEALQQLYAYTWPGNVRELESVIEQAVAMCSGAQITGAELPPQLQAPKAAPALQIPGSRLDAIERYAIIKTLEATAGSTSRAAEILGISIRKVQYKLHEYQGSPANGVAAVAGFKRN